MTSASFHIESSTPRSCFEVAAFRLSELPNLHERLPLDPGAAWTDGQGRRHLHFSPGRWLTLCPSAAAAPPELPASVAVVDVSGKWHRLRLTGADAERVLRFQLAVDHIFAGRACAAARAFDCPAVIERDSAGFDVWTHASYSEHLRSALADAHRNLQHTMPTEAM